MLNWINYFYNHIKINYEVIFLIIVASLILTNFHNPTELIIGGDQGIIHNSQNNFIEKTFLWSHNLGGLVVPQTIPHSSYKGSIAFFEILGFGLPIIQRIYFFTLYLLVGLSCFYFIRELDFGDKSIPIIGAIFYMYNFYSLVYLSAPNLILNFIYMITFPLLFFTLLRFYSHDKLTWKKILLVLVSTIFIIPTAGNPPFLVLIWLLIGSYTLFIILSDRNNYKHYIKRFSLLFLIYFLISSVWIFPMFFGVSAASKDVSETGIQDWVQWMSHKSSFSNLISLGGDTCFGESYANLPFYWFADLYLHNHLLVLLAYFFSILAFSSIIFYRKNKIIWYFSFLSLILLFLAKGIHEPFTDLSKFIYYELPIMWIFRSPYQKFMLGVSLCYAVLISYSTGYIINKIEKKKNKLVATAMIGILIIGFAFPLWTGNASRIPKDNIFNSSWHVDIPEYHLETSNYLNNKEGDYRVFRLPPQRYVRYKWGYSGSHMYTILLNKPFVHLYWGHKGNSKFSDLQKESYTSIKDKNAERFLEIITILGIKYIIVPLDIETKYYGTTNPYKIVKFLNQTNNIIFDKKIGEVVIFENKNFKPHIYSPEQVLVTDHQDIRPNIPFIESTVIDQIKSSEFNINTITFFENPNIIFKKINPTKYTVEIENATEPFLLVFSESYHHQWKAYTEDKETEFNEIIASYDKVKEARHEMSLTPSDISYLFKKPLSDDNHLLVNDYVNAWYIVPKEIDKDRDGNFVVTLFFWPQIFFYLGLFISGMAFFCCLGYLFYNWRKLKSNL